MHHCTCFSSQSWQKQYFPKKHYVLPQLKKLCLLKTTLHKEFFKALESWNFVLKYLFIMIIREEIVKQKAPWWLRCDAPQCPAEGAHVTAPLPMTIDVFSTLSFGYSGRNSSSGRKSTHFKVPSAHRLQLVHSEMPLCISWFAFAVLASLGAKRLAITLNKNMSTWVPFHNRKAYTLK